MRGTEEEEEKKKNSDINHDGNMTRIVITHDGAHANACTAAAMIAIATTDAPGNEQEN